MRLPNPLDLHHETLVPIEEPLRAGPRPKVVHLLPHRQLDQWPPPAIFDEFVRRCLGADLVETKESRMAASDTHALFIPEDRALGPREAFIDDHEFCHIHPLPEGSVHMTLPAGIRKWAIGHGWAEEHPLVSSGAVPDTLVMVYAPRDEQELEVVFMLFEASLRFAQTLADPT
jgi:phospholipase/carboxylesterase